MSGCLTGVRIVEMAGIGPGPFAGMMLADHGAEVVRICRPGTEFVPAEILLRSRKSLVLDLKKPEALDICRRLIASADGVIEGFRPGVMERLGLGPEVLMKTSPALVYGRMTGWGQTGNYADLPGHDINYIALAGVLDSLGRAGEKPTPPINLVGDFGGGGMLLAFGMVSALLHSHKTGVGQVIDCAMTDGAALLMSMVWGFRAAGSWSGPRGTNLLDTGAHFYDTYETADGKFISIGAIEPQFYRELLLRLQIQDQAFELQDDAAQWQSLRVKLTAIFKNKTREAWCRLFEGSPACFAPVLNMAEAPHHPHNAQRQTFIELEGVMQPAPAPRFSASPAERPRPPTPPGTGTRQILRELGYGDAEVVRLQEESAILLID